MSVWVCVADKILASTQMQIHNFYVYLYVYCSKQHSLVLNYRIVFH